MKKILFNTESVTHSFEINSKTSSGGNGSIITAKKRTKEYLDLIKKIDTKTVTETKGMQSLLDEICKEFGTADVASLPLGIVSKCFLGHPYEVHLIDINGGVIVNHYKINEILPSQFEKARALAVHNAYALVEVYNDRMVIIREDGSLTKIDG